jgi:hypothetical protein
MNYLSVVLAGILIFIALHWFIIKRKTFTGPVSLLATHTDESRANLWQSVTLEGLEMALALTRLHDAEAIAQLQRETEAKVSETNVPSTGNEKTANEA